MINVLGAALIGILSGVDIYCIGYICGYLHDRSRERTDERRAHYRAKAYKAVNERRALKENRQKLWRSVRK